MGIWCFGFAILKKICKAELMVRGEKSWLLVVVSRGSGIVGTPRCWYRWLLASYV